MNQQEKANDLYEKLGKQYALICVDEILNVCWGYDNYSGEFSMVKYWNEVKELIQNQ